MRRGDEEWFTLVKWVLFALIEAEERGVTRENVRTLATTTTDPALQHQLDLSGGVGKALGVNADWVARIVSSVGNYGEMFERNLGTRAPYAWSEDSTGCGRREACCMHRRFNKGKVGLSG